jgi:D-alanyl-D-alanine carboxypeptidase
VRARSHRGVGVARPEGRRIAIDRRTFLTAGGTVSLAALVAACGSDDESGGGSATTPPPGTTGAPTTATAASPGSLPVMDDVTMATLDRVFAEQFEATGLVGLAGVVRIGDGVWTGSTGAVDLETGEPFRAGDFVRIASISKTYTASTVLILVDEGLIDLDAVLETYVPGVINGDVATIADLLGMRSGIPDFTANDELVERFTADPTLPWSNDDTLRVIAEAPGPDFAPGEKVVYCDSNYFLLGMVIEEVTGELAGSVITTRVIDPLGLTSTSYPTDVTIPEPHPTGYVPDIADPSEPFDNEAKPPSVVNELNPAVPSTAGAMISTLEDMQTWGTELVEGSLLTPETQAKRLETHQFTGQQVNFGYGLGITNLNEFLGHDGAILGFSTFVMTRPQTDTQIAFIANESNNFTTPTLTVALGVIRELYPDQLR